MNILELIAFGAICGITTFLVWRDFHWVGVVEFLIFAFVTEMFYQMRWRQSIKCKHCAFDPITYKKDPALMAQTVKDFLARRKEDPHYLLKPQPQIKPIIKKVKNFKLPETHL